MATVSEFFNTIRYDLRDFGGQDYDDDQLLMYLNRAINILDLELFRLKSDWTVQINDSVTLASGGYSMNAPSGCSTVRRIFRDQTQKYELEWDRINKRRIYNSSGTGEPTHWAQRGSTIEWDSTADQEYTFTVIFDKWTGSLALTDNMPYSDNFNYYLTQGTTMMADNAKKNGSERADASVHSLFRTSLFRDNVARENRERWYHLDF